MLVSKEVPEFIQDFRRCSLDIEEILLLSLYSCAPKELEPQHSTFDYPIILGADFRDLMLSHELIKQGFKVKRVDCLLFIIFLRMIMFIQHSLQPLLRNNIRLDLIKLLLNKSTNSRNIITDLLTLLIRTDNPCLILFSLLIPPKRIDLQIDHDCNVHTSSATDSHVDLSKIIDLVSLSLFLDQKLY